jgi:hypothetical protein
MSRRPYRSGSLYIKGGSWYGRWHIGGERIKRKLGPVRPPGSREGLTKAQAERELRRRIESEAPAASVRLTLERAGERHLHHLEHVLGRKRSRMQDYGFALQRHLVPYFGDRLLERIALMTYGPTSGVRAARAMHDRRS